MKRGTNPNSLKNLTGEFGFKKGHISPFRAIKEEIIWDN